MMVTNRFAYVPVLDCATALTSIHAGTVLMVALCPLVLGHCWGTTIVRLNLCTTNWDHQLYAYSKALTVREDENATSSEGIRSRWMRSADEISDGSIFLQMLFVEVDFATCC